MAVADHDVAVVQSVIKNTFQNNLVVDGLLGGSTRSAFYNLSFTSSVMLDLLLLEKGVSMARKVIAGDRGFELPQQLYLPMDSAPSLVAKACALAKVPQWTSYIQFFLSLEAAKLQVGGVPCYDNLSRNGSHRGLFQFSADAWDVARKELMIANPGMGDLGEYQEKVYHPGYNIMAAIGYALANSRDLVNLGVPINGETLYIAHNQGSGFFKRGKTLNLSGQSSEARAVVQKWQAWVQARG